MQEIWGCVRNTAKSTLVSPLYGAEVFTHQLTEEEAKARRAQMP